MRYISIFSGIEAASVAWEPLGWEPVCFSEIDEFPSAVLAARFPDVPNYGDITKIDWKEVAARHGAVDVVVGGSPCQSFSIAGGRESLRGESRLMFEYIRAVDEVRPRWLLWENVCGVLSARDDAFGQLLENLSQLGYSLAWRVLDAQFFHLAQRRQRVFLVGHLGGMGGEPAAVLFDSESVRGNTLSSREKRAQLARASRQRPALGGGDVDCLTPWEKQTQRIYDGEGIFPTLPSNSGGGQNRQAVLCLETGQAAAAAAAAPNEDVAPTLNCNHEQPILVIGSDSSRPTCDVDVVPTLHVGGAVPMVARSSALCAQGTPRASGSST